MRTLDKLMDALELAIQLDEEKGADGFVNTMSLQEVAAIARVFTLMSQIAKPITLLAATLKSSMGFLKNLKGD